MALHAFHRVLGVVALSGALVAGTLPAVAVGTATAAPGAAVGAVDTGWAAIPAKSSKRTTKVWGWPSRPQAVRVSGPAGRVVAVQYKKGKKGNKRWVTVRKVRTSAESTVDVSFIAAEQGKWRLKVTARKNWTKRTTQAVRAERIRALQPPAAPAASQPAVEAGTNDAASTVTDNQGAIDSVSYPVSVSSVVGGRPDAGNTGVPDGVVLRDLAVVGSPYPGDYVSGDRFVITTANAVYDRWQFDYLVEVRAPGVRFTRSWFRGVRNNPGSSALLYVRPETYPVGQPSAVVEDSTLIPAFPNNTIDGVRGSNVTLRRVEITDTVDGVHVHGTTVRTDPNAGNVTVEASWIHDLPHYLDSSHSDGSHNDGVQVIGGRNIRIVGTRIDGEMYNAALMVTAGRNDVSNVVVTGSWLAGGGCTVNVYDGDVPEAIKGLALTSNVYTRGTTRHTDCAMIVSSRTKAVTTASANTWHNNSTPLPTVRTGG